MCKKLQTNWLRELQEQTLINCLQAGGIIYIQYKNKLKERKKNERTTKRSQSLIEVNQ